ncbi:hypothetical protein L3556_04845 [Candidatus Synechococcus calcipolaris G9]|uniref:Uncharacterized protein n=1 Tax=Candidatus Synechococcus calcipolaris G9 TaxID=1497997 RepID=A0ABT6EWV8_9SYNE|nr:hypothetical protein [Candidatus Synechococcus calcipolaris]MDG2990265.1 hypothetical protein [Candidatus Synechococcus calcipolaris G9]
MASLFDQNFRYTDRARSIYKDLQSNLHPIYIELIEEGFSPREITVLVTNAATQTENEVVNEWDEAKIPAKSPLPSN